MVPKSCQSKQNYFFNEPKNMQNDAEEMKKWSD